MGHLQTQQAEIGDMDLAERLIMGGIECVAATAFHEDIRYVALGHIHRAQRVGADPRMLHGRRRHADT